MLLSRWERWPLCHVPETSELSYVKRGVAWCALTAPAWERSPVGAAVAALRLILVLRQNESVSARGGSDGRTTRRGVSRNWANSSAQSADETGRQRRLRPRRSYESHAPTALIQADSVDNGVEPHPRLLSSAGPSFLWNMSLLSCARFLSLPARSPALHVPPHLVLLPVRGRRFGPLRSRGSPLRLGELVAQPLNLLVLGLQHVVRHRLVRFKVSLHTRQCARLGMAGGFKYTTARLLQGTPVEELPQSRSAD